MIKWFVDNTLDVALAYLRVLTLLSPLATVGCLYASIWTGDWHWLASGLLAAFLGTCTGAISFYLWGNEDWRDAWPSRRWKKSATS
jgi:hypothetical protein